MERLSVLDPVLRSEQLEWLRRNMENTEHAMMFVRDAVESAIKEAAGRPDYEEAWREDEGEG